MRETLRSQVIEMVLATDMKQVAGEGAGERVGCGADSELIYVWSGVKAEAGWYWWL